MKSSSKVSSLESPFEVVLVLWHMTMSLPFSSKNEAISGISENTSISAHGKNSLVGINNSVAINIDLDEPIISKNSNSVKKVRLIDTRPRVRSQSATYPDTLAHDISPPFMFPSSSGQQSQFDQFPTKHYSNEEALRMSEERLLAELMDPHGSEHSLGYDFGGQRSSSNLSTKHKLERWNNVDSQDDEFQEEEGADVFNGESFLGGGAGQTTFPARQSPSPLPGRPTQLKFAKPPFGRAGSFTSSNVWMSMSTHDDDYMRHECVEKCSSSLHLAVKTGNVDEIEILLETGSDTNSKVLSTIFLCQAYWNIFSVLLYCCID